MTRIAYSLISTNGLLRIDVVERQTGGYQLEYSRHVEERVPEYDFVWEGWVPVPERVTLTDTLQRGEELAVEAMTLWERQEADSVT
jgi:hypothetical protein